MAKYKEYSEEAKNLLKKTASPERAVASQHMQALAAEIRPVLQKAVFDEDTLGGIFTKVDVSGGGDCKFPLDIIAPGTEDDFVAFTMPKQGRVPERHVEGDELYVQTYKIANAIDWDLDFAKDSRWDVVERALEVFKAGFTKRINDDGWHVILASAEASAFKIASGGAGTKFDPELIYKMKTTQRRRTRNGDLTDLYISSEAMEDIRLWGASEISDISRHQLFMNQDDPSVVRINGVNLHELRELGVGQEYETYLTTTLSYAHGTSGNEWVIGLDLSKRDSFIMPVRTGLELFETGEQLHRQGRAGFYGWMRLGMAAVDSRRAIAGEF